jgi:NADH-quinone oxidoreductase subunit K
MAPHISAYFFVGAAMFLLGIFTMVSRRNAIYVLMGAELILNAAALNFVAFSRWLASTGANALDGQMFAIFIVILAAAEAAVALGIVLQLYQHFPSIDISKPNRLSD